MGILNRLKHFLPIQTKVLIYNSLVLSYLNFGILLCGFKCDKVFKLQTNIIRILSLSKYNAYTDALFKQLKLLKVNDILKLQELKLSYKYKNLKLPHYLQILPFHPNTKTHDHDTRIKHHIHHPSFWVNTLINIFYICISVIVNLSFKYSDHFLYMWRCCKSSNVKKNSTLVIFYWWLLW